MLSSSRAPSLILSRSDLAARRAERRDRGAESLRARAPIRREFSSYLGTAECFFFFFEESERAKAEASKEKKVDRSRAPLSHSRSLDPTPLLSLLYLHLQQWLSVPWPPARRPLAPSSAAAAGAAPSLLLSPLPLLPSSTSSASAAAAAASSHPRRLVVSLCELFLRFSSRSQCPIAIFE